jgi:hypothetical protein
MGSHLCLQLQAIKWSTLFGVQLQSCSVFLYSSLSFHTSSTECHAYAFSIQNSLLKGSLVENLLVNFDDYRILFDFFTNIDLF